MIQLGSEDTRVETRLPGEDTIILLRKAQCRAHKLLFVASLTAVLTDNTQHYNDDNSHANPHYDQRPLLVLPPVFLLHFLGGGGEGVALYNQSIWGRQ